MQRRPKSCFRSSGTAGACWGTNGGRLPRRRPHKGCLSNNFHDCLFTCRFGLPYSAGSWSRRGKAWPNHERSDTCWFLFRRWRLWNGNASCGRHVENDWLALSWTVSFQLQLHPNGKSEEALPKKCKAFFSHSLITSGGQQPRPAEPPRGEHEAIFEQTTEQSQPKENKRRFSSEPARTLSCPRPWLWPSKTRWRSHLRRHAILPSLSHRLRPRRSRLPCALSSPRTEKRHFLAK